MPRALGIGFYDANGVPLWVAEGYDGPDPAPLVAAALADVPPATTGRIDGFMQDHEGAPAYVFRLRNDEGNVIAVATLLTRDGEDRPYSFVQSMVQPALECLQRELESRASVDVLTRDLRSRDDDLELLLKMAPDDPDSPMQGDELGVLVQTCVDHLGCLLGALVVPERNVAVCKAPRGERPQVEILTKIHRHLLNWAQLQRRNLVINKIKVRPIELPPYKILCTPVRHASGRVIGFLAMFREEGAPNFEPRTERLVELLSRKTTTTLQNNFDALTSLLTRSAFETQVRAQLASRRQPAPECVLYMDVDRMHVVNDNFGMHVGDELIGKVAEVLRKKAAPGRACRAHRRRPLRGVPAGLHARIRAADRRDAAAPVRGAHLRARRRHGAGVGQRRRRRAARGIAAPARARPRERRDRLQGGEGPRPQPRRDLPGRGPEHHAPQHGHRRRAGAARGARGGPVRAVRAADPSARRRAHGAALRVPAPDGQREQRAAAAGEIPFRGGALPAPAGDRPLGGQERARDARAACVVAARPRDALLDEHLRRLDRRGGFPGVPRGLDPRLRRAAGDRSASS